jgi:DNA-binding MarR family transcriptional regulator
MGAMAAMQLRDSTSAGAGVLLAVVGRAASDRLRQALVRSDLRPRQYQALGLLRDAGPSGQQALGEAMGVDPSILVTLLNPLEEQGLLTRRRDPADRRRHIVAITRAGEARLREAEQAHDAAQDELLSALDPDQRARLGELLLELQRGLAVPDDACKDDEATADC